MFSILCVMVLCASPTKSVAAQKSPEHLSIRALPQIDAEVPVYDAADRLRNSKGPYLVVFVTIDNLSDSKKVEYKGAAHVSLIPGAHVSDEFGNVYRMITFGFGSRAHGQRGDVSIYPGKIIVDTYLFEPPVEKAKTLQMTIKPDVFDESIPVIITFPSPQPKSLEPPTARSPR